MRTMTQRRYGCHLTGHDTLHRWRNMAFQQWENLARGDAEDSRIAAVEHVDDLKGEEKVCVCRCTGSWSVRR